MFVWVGKEANGVIVIGRVASVLDEMLCIGRVCRSHDSGRFSHINTVLLKINS